MKDKINPVGYAARWPKRNTTRRVFAYSLLASALLWYYCNMLQVVEPVQPTAFPGYSSTSTTCCCPLLQQYLVLPVAVSGYSSGDER